MGTSKSANPIEFPYISNNIKSSIKWAVDVLITPNLVSRHKMVILFECVQKFHKSIVPTDFQLFVNNRTMGFPKIDKGTMITIFSFNF